MLTGKLCEEAMVDEKCMKIYGKKCENMTFVKETGKKIRHAKDQSKFRHEKHNVETQPTLTGKTVHGCSLLVNHTSEEQRLVRFCLLCISLCP